MRRLCVFFATAMLPVCAFGQSVADDTEQAMLQQQASQAALHQCVKAYALKYVKTSASPSEVVEAALSACNTENAMLLAATTKLSGSVDGSTDVLERAQRTAQRAGIRALLEARHGIH